MLTAYALGKTGPIRLPGADDRLPPETAWVDLFNPLRSEDAAAEQTLGVSIPTLEEAAEIEFSSRFYVEDGAVYLTASLLTGADEETPTISPFTFVLRGDKVATIRYQESRSFRQFLGRAVKGENTCTDAQGVVLGLLEAIVDRLADVIERAGHEIDLLNRDVFAASRQRSRAARRLEVLIGKVGQHGDVLGKARESLASLQRLIQFATSAANSFGSKSRMKLLDRDLRSLADQLGYLAGKVTFLLDATLGMITVQQNEVIRVLTVASMMFFPPTLIATIYGMNFRNMPELDWFLGYPVAIFAMVLSALLPYLYFRRRGWL